MTNVTDKPVFWAIRQAMNLPFGLKANARPNSQ